MRELSRREALHVGGAGAACVCVSGCSTRAAEPDRPTLPRPSRSTPPSGVEPIAALHDIGDQPLPIVDPVTRAEAFLVKRAGTVTMLSAVCTHAGCIVTWSRGDQHFVCPCHGGTYAANGNVASGPPTEPLGHLDIKVRHGRVYRRS